ncbi:hypothetical protein FPV67DRAFT_1678284 [Lyophyllum atratum]|nr:hypothetical protein FPV67DRAFT_1678284 [Lyophyllum atratum]
MLVQQQVEPPRLWDHAEARENPLDPQIPAESPAHSPPQSPRGSPGRTPPPPRNATPPALDNNQAEVVEKHPLIDGSRCDADGYDHPPNSPPPPRPERDMEDYSPFSSRAEFELAEFLYVEEEMSAGKIDRLMHILAAFYERPPPVSGYQELYSAIDSVEQGDIPWTSFSITFSGAVPDDAPQWMTEKYEVWYRDPLQVLEQQIGNPDFNGRIDYTPKRVTKDGKRRYKDLMSGQWAWRQADEIAKDEDCHGAMFAPVVLGSDKTTVSVATGQNDFYPLYASLGNVHNSIRQAHKNAVALIGFLAIPKTSREHAGKADFRKFRRQLFHTSLEHILSSLKPHMTTPRVTHCGDGYFRRVIYGIGPYIADYPEQALLACIVQGWCTTHTANPDDLDAAAGRRSQELTEALLEGCTLTELWDDYGIVGDLVPFTASFPRADIHELIAPDLLHQLIKGTFKDHLVEWITEYIKDNNPERRANEILADIDRRIAAAPSFPGLRHFHQGRGFKQWTGDDSKGLMKVYLASIVGHVPDQMVQAVSAFLEFCYLVRRNIIDDDTLDKLDNTLSCFHEHREVFRELGVRPEGFSLPRQHSMVHYPRLIRMFGAPNGLCSSITENKHIKAVKKPYRRSSRYKALGQMLVTNQRLDKLAMARVDFTARNMLVGPGLPIHMLLDLSTPPSPPPPPPPPPTTADNDSDESGAVDDPESQSEIKLAKTYVRGVPRDIYGLARHVDQPVVVHQYTYLNHPNSSAIYVSFN